MDRGNMKKIILFVLALTLILSFSTVEASAEVTLPERVRVGIHFGTGALSEAVVSAPGGVMVVTDTQSVWVPSATATLSSGTFTVLGGEVPIYDASPKITIISTGGFLEIGGKQFRGDIELVQNGDKITVVNYLNIEEYLYGVVPLEMSTGWPIEALKAQAVCARTYVAKSIGKYMSQGFDVYNTTMSQVYGGVNVEKEDCTRAVDETKGIVLTFNGTLIDAVYCSSMSFGHSFNVKDVWGSDVGYLSGVKDFGLFEVFPEGYTWEVSFSKEQIKDKLAALSINIGDIFDLRIDETSPEGAVTKLTFVGTDGEHTVKNSSTRNTLALKSQGFTVEKEGEKPKVTVLSASGKTEVSEASAISSGGMLFSPTKALNSEDVYDCFVMNNITGFRIKGSGYGHGLGMSQYGAKGMALMGYTFDQIVTHYYTGAETVQITN